MGFTNQEKTLLDLKGDPSLVERLTELGFVPGEKIRFLHQIVGKGPIVVEVRGVSIALREEEAKCLKT